jgi:hypothetical protein
VWLTLSAAGWAHSHNVGEANLPEGSNYSAEADLKQVTGRSGWLRRTNSTLWKLATFLIIMSSFLNTVISQSNIDLGSIFSEIKIAALLSAVPGLLSAIIESFRFDRRAAWFGEREWRLLVIIRRLRVGTIDEKTAIDEFCDLEAELQPLWPQNRDDARPKLPVEKAAPPASEPAAPPPRQ